MKKQANEEKQTESSRGNIIPKTNFDTDEELKTDAPLSEKDEMKQAEERLRKSIKKNG